MSTAGVEEYDLVIVGAGSGNSIADDRFDDWRVAIIEKDLFGGTCLNRGCVPSKMYVYAAEVAETIKHAERYGVFGTFEGSDWVSVRDRVFGRIDPIVAAGEVWRSELPNTTVYKGTASFVEGTTLEVNGQRLTGRHTVLAAGSRPFIPKFPGLDDIPYFTSDDIMRIPERPERLVILGGGVIAAEMAHVFDGLGTKVTVVQRSDLLLSGEDDEIRAEFTARCRERFDLRTGTRELSFEATDDGFLLRCRDGEGSPVEIEADALLVATGRVANSDVLAVDKAGVVIDEAGRVVIDEFCRTNVPDVWAFGDLSAHHPLKHLANAEARMIAHNLLHPDDLRAVDYGHYPRATFGSPQVAAVGMTEQQLKAEGVPFVAGRRSYGDTAYGWALEDTTSFCKVLVSPVTGLLLGAHIMGPHASTLIQPLIQAMALGATAAEVAGVMYIHPALSEVVENTLLTAMEGLS
jgi:mycothione reductase